MLYLVPIHCHPTFHPLSTVTEPVLFKLGDWLWRQKQILMSYYLVKEMCIAFLDRNNTYHLLLQAKSNNVLPIQSKCGQTPLNSGETFICNCEAYMTLTVGGWNGTKEPHGLENGVTHYQCATNLPRTNYSNFKGLC
jgi:hypothetical protein